MLDSDAFFDRKRIMQRPRIVNTVARAVIVAILATTLGSAVTACGQRGPLYMPDKENPDKRR
jgi:hypothetical protein